MYESKFMNALRAEVRRASIKRVLELRFQIAVPRDIDTVLEGLTDLDELSSWFDAAVTAQSFAEFEAAVLTTAFAV